MRSKIFVAGLNDEWQLGIPPDSRSKEGFHSVSKPTPLCFSASHLVKISAGEYQTVYLFDNGQVYATGSDLNFRIGGPSRTRYSKMTRINVNNELVKDVFCGRNYTLYLTESGYVVFCTAKFPNSQVVIKIRRKVVKVSGNDDSPCVIDDNGNFYFFDNDPQIPPKKYHLSSKAIDIARGHRFSLILSEEGVVYGGGRLNSAAATKNFSPIESLNGIKCQSVYANQNHAAVLSIEGKVYIWGDGSSGQLGNGTKEDNDVFEELSIGPMKRIRSIGLGLWHSVFVTDDGDVYSTGENSCGQLLLGSFSKMLSPTQSNAIPQRATDVTCGTYNTFLICRKAKQ
ncbi:hypothetical protein TRFO_31978 [Tritrichomonas foetus]|uniref:Uncharacterized protein n=1 Tax=Tritrichomonas foetus TaxID=1144522 RepID=A0A1J4JVE7_9EUKA|nr:hypothetical protein TRFO_31978 [Tritrichomonas foetus]|eukprot:OHT01237.1 hypothetical protein TRFO_31978 [Tritrichomonas foetus]